MIHVTHKIVRTRKLKASPYVTGATRQAAEIGDIASKGRTLVPFADDLGMASNCQAAKRFGAAGSHRRWF